MHLKYSITENFNRTRTPYIQKKLKKKVILITLKKADQKLKFHGNRIWDPLMGGTFIIGCNHISLE